MNKREQRTYLKNLRFGMSAEDQAAKSEEICSRLITLDWSNVMVLHTFIPITSLKEVDIESFNTYMAKKYPKMAIYTSKKDNDEWHIVDYRTEQKTSLDKFDAFVVPLLGFDDQLNRIGYGGGYYDQLMKLSPHALKIGVGFEKQKVVHIQIEPHDVQLNTVITETTNHKN